MVFVNVVWNQVQFDNLKSQKLLDSELKYDDQVGFQIDSLQPNTPISGPISVLKPILAKISKITRRRK